MEEILEFLENLAGVFVFIVSVSLFILAISSLKSLDYAVFKSAHEKYVLYEKSIAFECSTLSEETSYLAGNTYNLEEVKGA